MINLILKMKNKQISYYFGLFAENIASLYLSFKFYKIIAKRFKTPFGEVDIIAKKGNQLVFIEVKARKDTGLMDFISKHQQQRITKAAQYFLLKEKKYQSYSIRFDAVMINKYFMLKHFISYW